MTSHIIEYPRTIPERVREEELPFLKELGVEPSQTAANVREHAALGLDRTACTQLLASIIRREYHDAKVVAYFGSARERRYAEVIHVARKPYVSGDLARREQLERVGVPTTTELISCDVGAMTHVYLGYHDMIRMVRLARHRVMYVIGHSFSDSFGTIASAKYDLAPVDGKIWVRMTVPGNSQPYVHPLPLWDRYEGTSGRLAWAQVGQTKWHNIYKFWLIDTPLPEAPAFRPLDVSADATEKIGHYQAFTWRRRIVLRTKDHVTVIKKEHVADIVGYIATVRDTEDKLEKARVRAARLVNATKEPRLMLAVEHLAVFAWAESLRARVAALNGAKDLRGICDAHTDVTADPTAGPSLRTMIRGVSDTVKRKIAAVAAATAGTGGLVAYAVAKGAMVMAAATGVGAAASVVVAAAVWSAQQGANRRALRRTVTYASDPCYAVSAVPPEVADLREFVDYQNFQLAMAGHDPGYLLECPDVPTRSEPKEIARSVGWSVARRPACQFNKDEATTLNAIANRILTEAPVSRIRLRPGGRVEVLAMHPESGAEIWERFFSKSALLERICAYLELTKPGRVQSWADFAAWLAAKPSPRARALLEADVEASNLPALATDRERAGAFTKAENFVPKKLGEKARVIVSASEAFQVATAIPVLAVTEAIKGWFKENVPGIKLALGWTAEEAAAAFSEALSNPGWVSYDADLSNCDTRQNVGWVTPILTQILMRAGAPADTIQAIVLNRQSPVYAFHCRNPDGRTTIKVRTPFQGLRSGDTWTTLANTLVAALVAHEAFIRAGVDASSVCVFVGGDDAAVFGAPDEAERLAAAMAEIYAEIGHKLEYELGLSFYSQLVLPADTRDPTLNVAVCPKPGKILAKTGYPPVLLKGPAAIGHARGLAMCLLPHMSHVPVVRELLSAVIRNTSGLAQRGYGLVGKSPVEYWGTGLSAKANDHTMAAFCERYKTDRGEIERVEYALRIVSRPPPYRLDHPLIHRMIEVDCGPTASWAELYGQYGITL